MNEQTAFDSLVGPEGKFSDAEALARAKIESDNFIEQLKREQAALRDELDERLGYEEFLTRMEQQSRQQTASSRPDNQPPERSNKAETANLTPQDIERIVELREQKKTRETNRSQALSHYAEVNGPNHASKLKQQASDLGMTEETLTNLAASNPKAFYRLTGLEEQRKVETFSPPPRTEVNTSAFTPTSGSTKNFAYYESIRQKDPREYWTPKVQNEMMKLLEQKGDDFYK